ncbi:hypothetical protein ACFPOI_16765 [Nonomuraea angiospora]|uniref:Secreted protein n=1 Tax=Nonomuraea angiospora TaxID=46172 RepID=A0ABR9MH80_9ACTN|nr:hypothetical protein [Nonomuraea angiospora]MBE1592291.1 hypothetical protein [Nonomuraea angiospora]
MRKTIVAAMPALALALSACAGTGLPSESGGAERQTGAQAERAPAGAAPEVAPSAPPQPSATGSSAEPSGTSASPAPQEPVASRKFGLDGRQMTLVITQLRREGKTTTLNFTLTHEDGPAWRIGHDLGQGPLDYTVGGISLVDTGNAKRYRPGRTGTKSCLCSETSGGKPIEEGRSYPFYAMFAAPPPEVTKVHIEIPQFGIITDVPIS